jgi:hypothetical protein
MTKSIRARSTQLLASVAIGAAILALTPFFGAWPQSMAQAQDGDSVSSEFRTALSPYGHWQRHRRWGEVWVVDGMAADWRPYTRGRWIYTDEWGWYWDVGPEEYAWGWVAYHYGRWAHDPEFGWIWIPGEDWGPAWVDWRYGDEYVGWAPMPPEELLVEYRDDPIYWSFVRPQYLLAPRVYLVFVPPRERIVIIRRTRIVNRTVIIDRNRDRDRRRGRIAVNAGIDPRIIARASGKPIRAAKVEPTVLRGTKVEGAREVDPGEGKRVRASVKESNTIIKPSNKVERPKELGANEKGRLGDRPPKAAQNVDGSDSERSSGDNRSRGNRSGDQGRSPPPPPPVNVIRGGAKDTGRSLTPSGASDRGNQQGRGLQSPPPPPGPNGRIGQQQLERRAIERDRIIQSPPPPPVNVIRGGSSNFGRSAPPSERGIQQAPRFQSPPPVIHRPPPPPPPPPPVVRRPPPPPPAMMRASPPPPVVNRAPPPPPPQQRGNRPNNRQQDDRLR